jgi:hypothetical protein
MVAIKMRAANAAANTIAFIACLSKARLKQNVAGRSLKANQSFSRKLELRAQTEVSGANRSSKNKPLSSSVALV